MFKEILLDENIELYTAYYKKATFKTIYHHPQYLLAEEKAEVYYTHLYIYEENEQFVILPSIKRRVNDIDVFSDESKEYFDLITPHEYSGVLASKYEIELFQKFYDELENYCVHNNIIFQFIRFNPYSEEYRAASKFCVNFSDAQNWIDCTVDVLLHFQKRKAEYVKSAIKKGMYCENAEKNEDNIKSFFVYYTKAMERLRARKLLYFNYRYFEELCKSEFTKLFFVKSSDASDIYSGAIVLCDRATGIIYYHLAFRNHKNGNVHSMEYMMYALSEWAKENGYVSMHLGGGSASLHQFKDGCTNKRVDYYTGHIVYQPQIYQALSDKYCEKYPEERNSAFLPKYRSRE